MATSTILAAVLAVGGAVVTGSPGAEKQPVETPEHQVVAIYFHRTQRCPTCKRIGAMAEQAVTQGFEKEANAPIVAFRFVDFQDGKNAKIVQSYGVDAPTLVLVNVFAGEAASWTNLPKVWQLVGRPDDFRAYVREGVARYRKQSREEAELEHEEAKESNR
ncbi:hypothetical protein Pla123a_34110 [Posidoniimonas polymericola]|uniref:Thioredoxin domain-containing protein n=1 Tax=Posidoniimonas polymericola TaxID=2528002 RepID=A0A5C5YI94_9BACT|nr:nitrophenyl compound nitroreductase subunit ArsF family protein [Posidoniimonas polymericola]TWT74587.1 hypothetical protein Pla123a_34110 [Posidoniimonas polymericola]